MLLSPSTFLPEFASAARHCAVLWFGEIRERGLFRELGYSSMPQYARMELGFTETRIRDFMRLTRRHEATAALGEAFPRGTSDPPAQIHVHQRVSCGHTRVLEVHHKQARARGGTHEPANLITLCAACHRLWHERL